MRRMPPRLWIMDSKHSALRFRFGGRYCLPIFKMCFNLPGFKLPLYGKVDFHHRNLQCEGKYLPLQQHEGEVQEDETGSGAEEGGLSSAGDDTGRSDDESEGVSNSERELAESKEIREGSSEKREK
jgi:hypothetical protein